MPRLSNTTGSGREGTKHESPTDRRYAMTSSTAPTPSAEVPQRESIKETLESLVVALILAFVFRAFIVEAFVIPTGSMAPTLYGAHGTLLCEDCGVEFAYGVRDLAEARRTREISRQSRAICPNCNHVNTNLPVSDDQMNPERGDRILVLKWPFDIGGASLGPSRWDVVVFKDPSDGTTNFIKRLVGLPNEVLMIADGDVYTVPLDQLSEEAVATLDTIRHEKYERREGIRRGGQLTPVPQNVLDELDEKMRIARKTATAQQPLWFTVYDNDYPPSKPDPRQPQWQASAGEASGWDTSLRRLTFTDAGTPNDAIELTGKNIETVCAYNIPAGRPEPVSDMRIRFVLTPESEDGTILVRLSKDRRQFWATVAFEGQVSLAESQEPPTETTPIMASTKLPPFVPGKSVEISFQNLDYRLALSIGEEEVLTSSDDPQSPAYYAPDLHSLRRMRPGYAPPPQIQGRGGSFELAHLAIQRDEYYYYDVAFRALSLPWAPRSGWASQESPLLLRGHEYFMLGDNTAASKDSRLWDEGAPHLRARGDAFQLGTVPQDQLIGKAFFVYWPAGHRIGWLPKIGTWNWPIIPDVGRMRWIR